VLMISLLSIPLEGDGRDSEVGVAELPLDDSQRDALAGHLDGVRVTKLVRRKASPYSSRDREPAKRATGRGR
jgi:hypothetical protein